MSRAVLAIALMPAVVFPLFAGAAAPARHLIEAAVIEGLPNELDIPDDVLLSIPLYYDAAAVGRAVRAWSKALSDNGYPYNRITTSITNRVSVESGGGGESDTLLTVRLTIDPDERVCMGPPLIIGSGGQKKMFYRDVRFTIGNLYNASVVDEAVRRLSARPYVKEVIASSPAIIGDAPMCCDSVPAAVVAFSVAERRAVTAEGALGYESGRGGAKGKLNGRLGLSFINTLGVGESAGVSYAGTSVTQRINASAALPWAFGLPVEAGASLAAEVEDGGYGFFGGELSGSVDIGPRMKGGLALSASETVPPDSVGNPYAFYGVDVFLSLNRKPLERGAAVPELSARAGSGAANRERSYARGRMEASAGMHCPIFKDYALAGRLCAKSLFTGEGYLPPAELYRMGGHGSLRGYSEEGFAFRSVAFFQSEALYYFNRANSVFIFIDGGLGFDASERLSMSNARELLGYGLGVRFPSRLGPVSIEWARNAGDEWGLGRVHVGIRAGME